MGRNPAKAVLQEWLARGGLAVGAYRQTYRARRQQIIAARGIDLAVDVGANDGRWVIGLRRGGYKGRVVSFEPDDRSYRLLRAAADNDPAWTHHQFALGSQAGQLDLNLAQSGLWNSFLPISATTVDDEVAARYIGVQKVAVRRLDDVLPDKERLMVKLDVQGYEREVLDGAPETLDSALVMEVELTPTALYHGQELMLELMARLDQNGLSLALVENVAARPDGAAMAFNGVFVRA